MLGRPSKRQMQSMTLVSMTLVFGLVNALAHLTTRKMPKRDESSIGEFELISVLVLCLYDTSVRIYINELPCVVLSRYLYDTPAIGQ